MILFKIMNIVEAAKELAQSAHEGQERKGGAPYITHPERVAQLVADAGFDKVTIAAAWLHDVLEDTDVTEQEVGKLSPELLEIVKAETEDSTLSWIERKKSRTDSLRTASDKAKAVACADRIDNLSDFLADYKEIGSELWERWPERTPQEKLAADQYFLQMLKETWQSDLVEKLEKLVLEEAGVVEG
jgi:(p)ppGpp synthase/HD superfamily hydrolase